MINALLTKIVGSKKRRRTLKRLRPIVERIKRSRRRSRALSDDASFRPK
jgi:preprotein translocase subunit SecA